MILRNLQKNAIASGHAIAIDLIRPYCVGALEMTATIVPKLFATRSRGPVISAQRSLILINSIAIACPIAIATFLSFWVRRGITSISKEI